MGNVERERRSDRDLARIIPSDMLRPIREIATSIPWMREMGLPVQFRVVVDANVVFAELLWLMGRRKKPNARTTLQELVAAGTVLLIAPTWLDQEVHEHAEENAAAAGVSTREYLLAWKAYSASICFLRTKDSARIPQVDRDDVAYVSVYQDVGAHAVYSGDHHVARMGARTIDQDVIITLRDYSRDAAWQYAIQYGAVAAVIASAQLLLASLQMLAGMARLVRSMPTSVKVLALAGGVGLLVHPRSRAWLANQARRAGSTLQVVGGKTARIALQLGAEATLKAQRAREALSKVENRFERRRLPLQVLVLTICLKEDRPLSLEEIERRALENGYRTRAKDFKAYLRRVLRESEDLAEVQTGWTYEGIVEAP